MIPPALVLPVLYLQSLDDESTVEKLRSWELNTKGRHLTFRSRNVSSIRLSKDVDEMTWVITGKAADRPVWTAFNMASVG